MATVAAGRLLLAFAAVSAIPGSAALATADPAPVSRVWLGRFGREVAAGLPVSGGAFTAGGYGKGGTLALWGHGTSSRFAGGGDDLALNGSVLTGTLGAERPDGPWLAGLALSRSAAEGAWRRGGQTGRVETSVTGVYPFTGYRIAGRVAVWCAGGYGIGGLELTPDAGDRLRTDVALLMAAAGARADLVQRGAATGPALSVEASGLYATTTSAAASGAPAAEADIHRIRLALEGSWGIGFGGSTVFTPTLQMGAHRDGGDAETGLGADIVGRLAVANASGTLAVALSGRMSLWHEASHLRDGGVSASLLLTTSW